MVAETDKRARGYIRYVVSASNIITIVGLLLLIIDIESFDNRPHRDSKLSRCIKPASKLEQIVFVIFHQNSVPRPTKSLFSRS